VTADGSETFDEVSRLIAREDAAALAALVCRNRVFMAPWDPARPDEFFTVTGQLSIIDELLDGHERGTTLPHVILDSAGQVAGRITGNITRGPFQSCGIGYWVSEHRNGQGLATAAVGRFRTIAFDQLDLHRLQAETLVHNVASQRVLIRNGFTRYGLAPQYLNIAGQWQDHVMFQAIRASDP
jgi:ribosomal-protein-alanine N-acetyltransferase